MCVVHKKEQQQTFALAKTLYITCLEGVYVFMYDSIFYIKKVARARVCYLTFIRIIS